MTYTRIAVIGLLLISIPLLLDPPEGAACGPFLPEAQFRFEHNPGPEFLRGELGIVSPRYYRRNLVVAYRYLSGAPLAAEEIQALSPKTAVRVERAPVTQPFGPDAAGRWLAARNAVPGVQAIRNIEVYRTGQDYMSYQNCLDDAFDTAAATLANRISRWGANSPQTAEWVRGQDQVFANCEGPPPEGPAVQPVAAPKPEPKVPGALPEGSDALLVADRQYQIAAAAFYSGKFASAEEGFRAVAANAQSPWRDSARYLIARTLIREGTVASRQEALASAEKALRDILDDPAQARWHQPAQRLLDLVRSRLYPDDRVLELGAALSRPGLGSGISLAMTDFTSLWERLSKGAGERNDLTDWIRSFQQGNTPHAIDQWRKAGGAVWLVAALAGVKAADPAAVDLIAAAREVRPEHPAYATVAYHGVALQTARGERDQARQWADEALAAKLPVATRNSLRGERMALARDWTEFLRYAPRTPVALTAIVADEDLGAYPGTEKPQPTFDQDFYDAFNRHVPLALWMDAAGNATLPRALQTRIAEAGWVRAALLNRNEEARVFARRVAELHPELAEGMRQYESEKPPEAARFAAVFWILRTPGLMPVVRQGLGRLTEVRKIDNYRDNWWNLPKLKDPNAQTPQYSPEVAVDRATDPPAFLSESQRAAGAQEWRALLTTTGIAPNYLCAQTLAWAGAHPDDPRVPEALHLAVRATRYGSTDAATSGFSRKAFQLLHSKYPQTKWAQMTKYWF